MRESFGGVMVGLLASSAEGCGSGPLPGQTKDIKIGICSTCMQHLGVRAKTV